MVNFSQVSHFTLGAYFDTGPLKWLYFVIILSVYILIVFSNLLLIVVICLNRTLHEPMYIFLCSLFVNELYGSTALYPFLLSQIPQDVHKVSYSFCIAHIFTIYYYGSLEFSSLSVISYDRYVAICFPLQYNTCMNNRKVAFLFILIWLPPFVAVLITTILTSSLTLCGDVIDTVLCDNYCVVKLSCFDTTINNLYELVAASIVVLLPVCIIIFTYIHIFKVCFNGSKQTRQKAASTCTPHICSLVNGAFGALFFVIQTRFNMSHWPPIVRIMLPLYHLTCQPLFNPLMYGLKLSKMRNVCKNVLTKNKMMIRMN
ncbi:olfactory receptor 1500-like [Boleophthalmus pectinirostris]|uniref:olfactory receptor 1500-like n=1 Tax=Boleophthalmus pectinirostris TaxID=150288 RepID=UPI00242B25CB|nr:olfactory receptor 1500-like [Boleophthalmus pectinirostris]